MLLLYEWELRLFAQGASVSGMVMLVAPKTIFYCFLIPPINQKWGPPCAVVLTLIKYSCTLWWQRGKVFFFNVLLMTAFFF